MKKSKNIAVALIVVFMIGGFGFYRFARNAGYLKEKAPEAISIGAIMDKQISEQTAAEPSSLTKNRPETPEAIPSLPPKELNLAMTFYTQAPFSNWSEPWQNACEEASILLVANAYYKHNWTREQFSDQILNLVDWENKTFGNYKSTNTQQMVQILEDFLKLKSVIHENPTFKDVQEVLNKGHLIIIPLAGKEIGNPFYKNGGPIYHTMVIKGYKEGEKVITEDVGTRRGENYVYQWETIINANHDYTTPMEDGAKIMIEVFPTT